LKKANPVDLSKKTSNNGNTTDIFKDLADTSKPAAQVGAKRLNVRFIYLMRLKPFAKDTNQTNNKQMKLK
jgi:hypothetical protein